MSEATVSADLGIARRAPEGLVMLCDVDLGLPDATCTHTLEVARGFARLGLDVDLIARGPDPRLAGIRYAAAGGAEGQRLTRLVTINGQAIRLLRRRRAGARRFYVRDKWTCFPAVLAARLLGYHVVLQVDGIPYGRGAAEGSPPARLVKLVVAIAMGRLAHGMLAVTQQIRGLLIELARVPPERISVIPNGVDLEFFTPLDRSEAIRRAGLDPGCRYIVFCGGLYPWTDFGAVVDAFAVVAGQRGDARLLLVGDGPERDRIAAQARALGVDDRVVLTGMVRERERVRDYLGAATVTLLAYRVEEVSRANVSPIKLMEYLASGRAVAGLEIPGLREIVEGSQAGVIVAGGASALADAILCLLDPAVADRCGAAGRRYAEEHLSWSVVAQRTLLLFRLPEGGR
ncbi:MAG TPA: glycosyltransferase family 4 protein [Solirubrobacteraceae bacterium]|nr:glycosyltransferase family 4 protein [Solirubrobacteraceae bacterium]